MSADLKTTLQTMETESGLLSCLNRGLEKESLRVSAEGAIAQTDHPSGLGAALTHSGITTDYSEALLELITPVHQDANALIQALADLHATVYNELPEGESLWLGSMPCALNGENSIRIAEYGPSNLGRLKYVYRVGLAHRYGRIMQSIAGLHFNFSMGNRFWEALVQLPKGRDFGADDCAGSGLTCSQAVKTAAYFALIRNFRRWSWLLVYLFGASPVVDASFFDGKPQGLEKLAHETYGLPYATSLRMSDFGYQNNAQSSLKICFNYLHSYIKTLFDATHLPYPPYQEIGVAHNGVYRQLNANLLQIENEYYDTIRPKRVTEPDEKPLQALERRGVEYIEVRCLDINPLMPLGIDAEQVAFMDAFAVTCLLEDSPLVSDAECDEIEENFNRTVKFGRSTDCQLTALGLDGVTTHPVADAGRMILDKVDLVAEHLDRESNGILYAKAVSTMRERLLEPDSTPSAQVLAGVRDNGRFLDWLLGLSQQHKTDFLKRPVSSQLLKKARLEKENSLRREAAMREADKLPFEQYLSEFLAD